MPTLDLRNRDLQDLFDTVVAGARAQNYVQSTTENEETGQYRGVGNRKCHFGHLIPDDLYDPAWDEEGAAVGTLRYNGNLLITDLQYELTRRLQNLHDDINKNPWCTAAKFVEEGFQDIAQEFNLVYTPPEEKKS